MEAIRWGLAVSTTGWWYCRKVYKDVSYKARWVSQLRLYRAGRLFLLCEQLLNDDQCCLPASNPPPSPPSLPLQQGGPKLPCDQLLCLHCGSSGQVVLVTQTCSRCSVTICLLTGERSREGLDSMTFTQVEQWILQAQFAWVHASWAPKSSIRAVQPEPNTHLV